MVGNRDEATDHRVERDSEETGVVDHVVGETDEAVCLRADVLRDVWGEDEADSNIDNEVYKASNQVNGKLFMLFHASPAHFF